MEWERIEEGLYRSRIQGGWLVSQVSYIEGDTASFKTESICFVPDEGHYWQILNKNEA